MIYWGNLRKLVLSVGTNGAILLDRGYIRLLSHAPASVSVKKVQRAYTFTFLTTYRRGCVGKDNN